MTLDQDLGGEGALCVLGCTRLECSVHPVELRVKSEEVGPWTALHDHSRSKYLFDISASDARKRLFIITALRNFSGPFREIKRRKSCSSFRSRRADL